MSITTTGSLVVLVAVIVVVFAAAATTSSADVAASTNKQPLPLVENLQQPASTAALDFIRYQCVKTRLTRPGAANQCYDLLFPYAASINGSYNRVSLAMVTVMVSKFKDLVKDLRDFGEAAADKLLQGCIKVLDEAIAGSKEALPKLGLLSTIANDKLPPDDPDAALVRSWILGVDQNFVKCRDGGLKRIMDRVRSSSAADYSEYASAAM